MIEKEIKENRKSVLLRNIRLIKCYFVLTQAGYINVFKLTCQIPAIKRYEVI